MKIPIIMISSFWNQELSSIRTDIFPVASTREFSKFAKIVNSNPLIPYTRWKWDTRDPEWTISLVKQFEKLSTRGVATVLNLPIVSFFSGLSHTWLKAKLCSNQPRCDRQKRKVICINVKTGNRQSGKYPDMIFRSKLHNCVSVDLMLKWNLPITAPHL